VKPSTTACIAPLRRDHEVRINRRAACRQQQYAYQQSRMHKVKSLRHQSYQ
jgi:hypothetical protein